MNKTFEKVRKKQPLKDESVKMYPIYKNPRVSQSFTKMSQILQNWYSFQKCKNAAGYFLWNTKNCGKSLQQCDNSRKKAAEHSSRHEN